MKQPVEVQLAMQSIPLRCSGCGSSLAIPQDIEEVTCLYCGTQQIVQRGEGFIGLKRIEGAISKVQHGTDRTAAELAHRRIKDELSEIEAKRTKLAEQKADALKHASTQFLWGLITALAGVLLLASGVWQFGIVMLAIAAACGWAGNQAGRLSASIEKCSIRVLGRRAAKLEAELQQQRQSLAVCHSEQVGASDGDESPV